MYSGTPLVRRPWKSCAKVILVEGWSLARFPSLRIQSEWFRKKNNGFKRGGSLTRVVFYQGSAVFSLSPPLALSLSLSCRQKDKLWLCSRLIVPVRKNKYCRHHLLEVEFCAMQKEQKPVDLVDIYRLRDWTKPVMYDCRGSLEWRNLLHGASAGHLEGMWGVLGQSDHHFVSFIRT